MREAGGGGADHSLQFGGDFCDLSQDKQCVCVCVSKAFGSGFSYSRPFHVQL